MEYMIKSYCFFPALPFKKGNERDKREGAGESGIGKQDSWLC